MYEYIIIDTAPTLDLLTVNALAAANNVIIPVCPEFLDAKGFEAMGETCLDKSSFITSMTLETDKLRMCRCLTDTYNIDSWICPPVATAFMTVP